MSLAADADMIGNGSPLVSRVPAAVAKKRKKCSAPSGHAATQRATNVRLGRASRRWRRRWPRVMCVAEPDVPRMRTSASCASASPVGDGTALQ